MKKRFRESRIAILIDLLLLPVLIPVGILIGGIPDAWQELKNLPSSLKTNWKGRHWI